MSQNNTSTPYDDRDNNYDSAEFMRVILCDVTWSKDDVPIPNWSAILYDLPPNGPLTIRHSARFKEDEIKNPKKGAVPATKIDLEGYQSAEISFGLNLNTDDDDIEGAQTALDKYKQLYSAYKEVDAKGRNKVFAVQHPLADAAGVQTVFISMLEVQETEGTDMLTVSVTLKELLRTTASKKGSGKAGGTAAATSSTTATSTGTGTNTPTTTGWIGGQSTTTTVNTTAKNTASGGDVAKKKEKTGLDDNK